MFVGYTIELIFYIIPFLLIELINNNYAKHNSPSTLYEASSVLMAITIIEIVIEIGISICDY